MTKYGPVDEVSDDGKQFAIYDITTGLSANHDFGAAGYAANAVLNIAAQGQVQVFGYDANGNTIAVTVAGVSVTLDGTGSAFMKRHPTDVTKAYFTYNLPNAQNKTYTFKAVFSKGSGTDQVTLTWQHQTRQ